MLTLDESHKGPSSGLCSEPYRNYAVQAAEDENGPYETVVHVNLLKLERLTITLEKAYAPYYQLVAL